MSLHFQDHDHYCDKECFDCIQKDAQLDNVKYWLEAVVEHLYSSEITYLDDFEVCLEELCRCVKINLPVTQLQFNKNNTPLEAKINLQMRNFTDEINWWKILNKKHLEQIKN